MNPATAVADGETVLRHIPGGSTWQGLPARPRITSQNFKLRADRGEVGLSVSRSPPATPEALVARIGDTATGSRVAAASVAVLRALGLEVVPVPLPDDPGHAEIRSAAADVFDQNVRRKLADLFQFC